MEKRAQKVEKALEVRHLHLLTQELPLAPCTSRAVWAERLPMRGKPQPVST